MRNPSFFEQAYFVFISGCLISMFRDLESSSECELPFVFSTVSARFFIIEVFRHLLFHHHRGFSVMCDFYYFCDSRNNIEIRRLSFLADCLWSEYLLKKIQILCSAVSIGVRFKFLKLPTTIKFSCDEASEFELCIRTPNSLRYHNSYLFIRSPRASPAFQCECETSYTLSSYIFFSPRRIKGAMNL